MGGIFASYRRDDSSGRTLHLVTELRRAVVCDRVFMDLDTIEPGRPFADVIDASLAQSTVVLVVIGPRWLGAGPDGGRRIDDPADFVRHEVAAALSRGLRVVPVLVDEARMPAEADLPADLKRLAGLQALEVSAARWAFDVERLVGVLVEAGFPRRARGRGLRLLGGGMASAAVAGVVAAWIGAGYDGCDRTGDATIAADAAEGEPVSPREETREVALTGPWIETGACDGGVPPDCRDAVAWRLEVPAPAGEARGYRDRFVEVEGAVACADTARLDGKMGQFPGGDGRPIPKWKHPIADLHGPQELRFCAPRAAGDAAGPLGVRVKLKYRKFQP